ncbi:MAG: hypothetical protein HFG13_07585 [Oscillibacter sp.]|nr:hypothetical protein [Oscillibacter sp.]
MEAGHTSGAFHSSWFNYIDIPGIYPGKMRYAVLKDECRDQFREAVQAKREEQLLAFQKFKEDARKRGKSVKLTDAQLEHLSASYNPKEMNQEEYQAFIDDLCEYGILDEADKDYISYSGLVPIDFSEPTCTGTAAPYQPYDRDFGSSGGNVLDWSKYLSTFEYFNSDTNRFEPTRNAILFERIQKVLVKMGG